MTLTEPRIARKTPSVRGIRQIRGSIRRDEAGAFPVVEAILVAVLVLTAILFFTSVQRPTTGGESRGQDLGQVATDTLGILQRRQFNIVAAPGCPASPAPPAGAQDLEAWMTRVLDGDCHTAAQVDTFLDDILPAGSHHELRLTNGVGSLVLLPPPSKDPGDPRGARAAQLPFFPHWRALNGSPPTAASSHTWPGAVLSDAASVPYKFTDPTSTITCIQAPDGSTTGPGGVAWASATHWRAILGTVPPWAMLGIWQGGTSTTAGPPATCGGTLSPLRVTLPDVRTIAAVTLTAPSGLSTATAAFTQADVGKLAIGTGIPANAAITTLGSATAVTVNKTFAAGGPITLLLVPDPTFALYGLQLVVWFGA
ncbi:MAG TPA: hypothetical protein VM241_08905 [Candidatus Thermoplasmatota archaeon]|nr:hypothetical protein [Candidatus Thermoplasmatota archaeon]